jgi:hypothetical protein
MVPFIPGRAPVAVLLLGLLPAARAEQPPLPFLDLATDERCGGGEVQLWCSEPWNRSNPRHIVGCGLPLTLGWPVRAGLAGEQLTYREGTRWVRREVTGKGSVELRPADEIGCCWLETLVPAPGRPGAFLSQLREFFISVRGVLPLAGQAEPGDGDGQGDAAGFREPFGLALVGDGHLQPPRLVVADAASHVVRTVSARRTVATAWGRPGEPGFRDGTGEARFRGPTFVAADLRVVGPDPWAEPRGFVLADSGNHAIRRIDEDGRVGTLAGTGEAGFRDADDPRQARFSDPRGLAMDSQGDVYVADRGNQVVRRIAHQGPVTTLAGAPGAPGSQDGRGAQARFSALGGLALDWPSGLYVVDGHALRRISPEGEVATVLGVPDQPGFRDDWESGKAGLAGVPCLRDPCGIVAAGGRIYIADQGNHAVREFDPGTGTLKTLAGDPALETLRPGLLRDGIPGQLDPVYAALGSPRGLSVDRFGRIFVATGAQLLQLCRQRPEDPGPGALTVPEAVAAGEACGVAWRAPGNRPLRYTLDFLHGDGTLADRRQGTATGGGMVRAEGRFTRSGPARVLLRWVTDQGLSRSAQASVLVP